MLYNTLIYEKGEGIGIVTINRPQSLNALNREAYQELFRLFLEIEKDIDTCVVIITSSGRKAFVAGTDVSSMATLGTAEARVYSDEMRKTSDLICHLRKPVIAAINGFALGGGCELAMWADVRIAADNARFGLPETNLAIIPGTGGTQRLPRLVGMTRAKELIFGGGTIDATTALNWGLVNKVVPEANLISEAKELAKTYLSKSMIALALAKMAMNAGVNVDLSTALDIEQQCFVECFSTEDQKEGMSAFLQKRKAQFTNK